MTRHAISGHPLDETLKERGSRYGSFEGHAQVAVDLKQVIDEAVQRRELGTFTSSQIEALHMIAHKMGRILNGDPNYDDSWVDIAGYSQLIVKQIQGEGI